LVALDPLQLRLLRRHQQLEHVQPLAAVQVVRQPLQPRRLPLVQGLLPLGVVTHQHLAEGRVHRLDVFGEVLAVLEIELVLAALLGRAGRDVAAAVGVAEDGGAELLIDQDARLLLRHPGSDGHLEALVDDLLGGGDLRRLRRRQRVLVAEQLRLERTAAIERQHVQPLIRANSHGCISFECSSLRGRTQMRRASRTRNGTTARKTTSNSPLPGLPAPWTKASSGTTAPVATITSDSRWWKRPTSVS